MPGSKSAPANSCGGPAGSRHTAWSPNGGMFIAMFQIPNKFFDVDGKVVDASGKEWDPAWAHLLPA